MKAHINFNFPSVKALVMASSNDSVAKGEGDLNKVQEDISMSKSKTVNGSDDFMGEGGTLPHHEEEENSDSTSSDHFFSSDESLGEGLVVGYSSGHSLNEDSDDSDDKCEEQSSSSAMPACHEDPKYESDLSYSVDSNDSDEDDDDKTSLMRACEKAREDLVLNFLMKVKDVNKTCAKWGNTALHYTCMDDRVMNGHARDANERIKKRIVIAQMLLEHGAEYKENKRGMTPIYYAGLYKMKELVEYLSSSEALKGVVSKEEKIRGIEFIGVSHAIFGHQAVMAYKFFLDAMLERVKLPSGPSQFPELEELFERSECKSVEALEKIKDDGSALEIEGVLVAGRVFPKEDFPHNALFGYAMENVTKKKKKAKRLGLSICRRLMCFAMKHETGRLMYVTMLLDELEDVVNSHGGDAPIFTCIDDLMESFLLGLDDADAIKLRHQRKRLARRVANILYTYICHHKGSRSEPLLTTTEKIIKKLYVPRKLPTPGSWSGYPSGVTCHLMDLFWHSQTYGIFNVEAFFDCFKHVISRLLHLESPWYEVNDKNCIHVLVEGVREYESVMFSEKYRYMFGLQASAQENWRRCVLSLLRMFIRHGCNFTDEAFLGRERYAREYMNPYEYAQEHIDLGSDDSNSDGLGCRDPNCKDEDCTTCPPPCKWGKRYLELLTVPVSPLPLAELAARTVLMRKIPYKDLLPPTVCEFVSGEHADPYSG